MPEHEPNAGSPNQITQNEPGCNGQKALRVAAESQPRKVAGAIAGLIRDTGCAELHAVGPQSVNQTAKAVALSRSYLTEDGITINTEIDFIIVDINGEPRNALRFLVKRR